MKLFSCLILAFVCCSFSGESSYFFSQTFKSSPELTLTLDLPGEVDIISWSKDYIAVETHVFNIPSSDIWNYLKNEFLVGGVGVFDEFRIEKKEALIIFENGKAIYPRFRYLVYVPFFTEVGTICQGRTAAAY